MANFSGRFSTNDNASTKVCNGLVEFYADWQIIRDLENNTYKYKADVYMDATKCKYLKTEDDKNISDAPSGVQWLRVYPEQGSEESLVYGSFYMPEFGLLSFDTSKVQHLHSAETEAQSIGEDPITLKLRAKINPNDYLRAYENNIFSGVASSLAQHGQDAFSSEFTVRGISPNTIRSIDGGSFLGQPQTIKVNKTEPEFTHTIEYSYTKTNEDGESEVVTVVVCEKSSAESISFTPSEALAELNTHGTDIEASFRITTYYGNTNKGTRNFAHTFHIPETIIPSCTVEVIDGEGLSDVYGGFLQGHSRFRIRVIPALAYGSPIQAYEVDVDGLVYTLTKPEMDTALIKYSGAHSIKARVLDYRGHWSDYSSVTGDVITYNGPVISELTAVRSDINGVENEKGDYFKVVFSSVVTPLDGKNTATYVVMHSKTTGLDYIERVIDDFTGQYTVNNGVYIFPADKDSTYTVQLKVIDNFEEHSRVTGGGLVVILQSWLASGRGMCFGGRATLEDTVECQFKFYPSGGLIIPPYPYEDLFVKEQNVYYVEKASSVSGSPTTDPYILEIYFTNPSGTDVVQRITTCPKKGGVPKVLVRACRESNWGDFCDMTTGQSL